MIHKQIKVSGKVQGVFFRASTRAKAQELNLKGIVRNDQDGSVYIEVEGDENAVIQFLDWCRQGPSAANVQKIEERNGDIKNFSSFEIIRN
jgi:acylphosphatase